MFSPSSWKMPLFLLLLCCRCGDFSIKPRAQNGRTDPSSQTDDGPNQDEALVQAIMDGDTKSIKKFLKTGVDPNSVNRFGDSALIWAVNRENHALTAELLDRGADPNQEGSYQKTALHWAAEKRLSTMISRLLEAGADPNRREYRGASPIHAAAAADHARGIRLLLDGGANLQIQDWQGDSALHLAVSNNAAAAVEILMLRGMDPDLINRAGESALQAANRQNRAHLFRSPPLAKKFPHLRAKMIALMEVVEQNRDHAPTIRPGHLSERIHYLINREREEHGLAALVYDETLAAIAQAHSRNMSANNFFSHKNPAGEEPSDRALKAGYRLLRDLGPRLEARYGIGENIYQRWVYSSKSISFQNGKKFIHYNWSTAEELAETAVESWMNSRGHRENILNPLFIKQGLGIAVTTEFKIYFTQNLW